MKKVILTIVCGKLWIAYIPEPINHASGSEGTIQVSVEENSKDEDKQNDDPVLRKEKGSNIIKKAKRRICMCPLIQGLEKCRFERANNNHALAHHNCPLLSHRVLVQVPTPVVLGSPFDILSNTHGQTFNSMQLVSLRMLLSFITNTPLSFLQFGSQTFNQLIHGLVRQGQLYPNLPTTSIVPTLSRQRVPAIIAQESNRLYEQLFQGIQGQYISLLFDAGDINNQHYLVVCIQQFSRSTKPIFFQLTNGPWTKLNYITFLKQIVSYLQTWSVRVSSICTDGLPAQVYAIKESIEQMQQSGQFNSVAPLLIPFYIPCFNHRTNLVVQRLSQLPVTSGIIETVKRFAREANQKDCQQILKKVCPSFINTRWLSLSLVSAYVRLKRKTILEHNLLSCESIHDILKLEIILNPLMELHRFFESHLTKLCDVYPALLRALLQYNALLKHQVFKHGPWFQVIIHTMVQLFNETLCGFVGSLIELSFYLSPSGKKLYRNKQFLSAFNPQRTLTEAIADVVRISDSPSWLVSSLPLLLEDSETIILQKAFVNIEYYQRDISFQSYNPQSHSCTDELCTPGNVTNNISSQTSTTPSLSLTSTLATSSCSARWDVACSSTQDEPCYLNSLLKPPLRITVSDKIPQSVNVRSIEEALSNYSDTTSQIDDSLSQEQHHDINNITERWIMRQDDLLDILASADDESFFRDIENDDDDPAGLLAEEERAKQDEYIEKQLLESTEQQRLYPRRSKRLAQKTQQQSAFQNSHTSETEQENITVPVLLEDSTESSEDDEVILTGATGTLHHHLGLSEAEEVQLLDSLFGSLSKRAGVDLDGRFQTHLRAILPQRLHVWVPLLTKRFRYEMFAAQDRNIISNQLSSVIYQHVVTALTYSPCSESECERIFSKAKFICGRRRHNLRLQTLNQLLSIVYLSH